MSPIAGPREEERVGLFEFLLLRGDCHRGDRGDFKAAEAQISQVAIRQAVQFPNRLAVQSATSKKVADAAEKCRESTSRSRIATGRTMVEIKKCHFNYRFSSSCAGPDVH